MKWNKVAIVGVGLLGGSLGMALRQQKLATEVMGFVRSLDKGMEAILAGAVDSASNNLAEVVAGADLVVLCTPIGRMAEMVGKMKGALKKGAIVTDVGSVKRSVEKAVAAKVKKQGGTFVGSHPMAGSEKIGVAHARADLFTGAKVVVTNRGSAAAKVEKLWKSVGGKVERMGAQAHDSAVAWASHLPHMVAAVVADTVLGNGKAVGRLCATGFKDTTRVASGSVDMWRDIAVANKGNLKKAMARVRSELAQWEKALGDEKKIETLLARAKKRRDAWAEGK